MGFLRRSSRLCRCLRTFGALGFDVTQTEDCARGRILNLVLRVLQAVNGSGQQTRVAAFGNGVESRGPHRAMCRRGSAFCNPPIAQTAKGNKSNSDLKAQTGQLLGIFEYFFLLVGQAGAGFAFSGEDRVEGVVARIVAKVMSAREAANMTAGSLSSFMLSNFGMALFAPISPSA